MKKTHYFLITALICLSVSCSHENVSDNLNESNTSKQVLEFSSLETANAKIEEVIKFKEEKESEIINKILDRSGNKVPTPNNIELTSKEVNKVELLDYLNFYHKEKLKVVYEERKIRGFTSLQNLADEINSLKLLEPKKSDDLYQEYSSLLSKNEFIVEPLEKNGLSNIYNLEGEVYINNEMLVSKNHQFSSSLKEGSVWASEEGVLAIGSFQEKDYLFITWHATIRSQNGLFNFRHLCAASFSSYVKINSQFILYPAWFYADPNSRATFFADTIIGSCPVKNVSFPTGAGTHIRSEDRHSSTCTVAPGDAITGLASGNFIIVFFCITHNT